MRGSLPGRPGKSAQTRRAPRQLLVHLALMRALVEPGDLGEEVSPAACDGLELGHRGGLLVAGQVAPFGAMPRLPGQLGDKEPVSLRAHVGHMF